MRTLLTIVRKDLRLLWRDRAGLIFLTIAPIVVITVAGFSLANLYGSDPTGETAYEFPLVDEDGGSLARAIRDRLAGESAVRLRIVASRDEAKRLVRDRKVAGTALVIPRGTQAALEAGDPASLILYVDTVKYLERLNVLTRLLELRADLVQQRVRDLISHTASQREHVEHELTRLRSELQDDRAQFQRSWADALAARQRTEHATRAAVQTLQRTIEERVQHAAESARAEMEAAVRSRVSDLQAQVRTYLDEVAHSRSAFEAWLAQLKRLAGSHAGDIPAPPAFPQLPPGLRDVLTDGAPVRLPTPLAVAVHLPPLSLPQIPPLQAPPEIQLPQLDLPPAPVAPADLAIRELNVSGGPLTINTFDQNVPGFSVTFLLLGMLLGVSLGLLDERDWGTLDRLRAMPVGTGHVLVGKLLSRFCVGVLQMVVLFAVGWVAFHVSLGPQPWALLLPIIGIVFAGTAFGLIVAAVAHSREAVLPVGSIVIVTMAAVGGCWWPIDLEPRWMRSVALAFPTTWAMDAFNDLMIRRRGVEVALWPTAVMLLYGLTYLVLGLLLFRRHVNAARA